MSDINLQCEQGEPSLGCVSSLYKEIEKKRAHRKNICFIDYHNSPKYFYIKNGCKVMNLMTFIHVPLQRSIGNLK